MKIYAHDYTLPAQADALLQEAQMRIHWNDLPEAKLRIDEAREKLLQYLSQDNMVEDDDVEGWVKLSDLSMGDGEDWKLI